MLLQVRIKPISCTFQPSIQQFETVTQGNMGAMPWITHAECGIAVSPIEHSHTKP